MKQASCRKAFALCFANAVGDHPECKVAMQVLQYEIGMRLQMVGTAK